MITLLSIGRRDCERRAGERLELESCTDAVKVVRFRIHVDGWAVFVDRLRTNPVILHE